MKQWNKETMQNAGLLALRIAVGVILIRHGLDKLTGIDGVIGMVGGLGFPFPVFWAWLLALVEFLGGIAVLIGFFTRLFAKILIIDMVLAILLVHTRTPFASTELALSMLGALVALFTIGGGKWMVTKKDWTLSPWR